MKKRLPTLKSDKQAQAFVAKADLSEYDLSGFTPTRFEFEKKSAIINMRLPEKLLAAVKKKANQRGIPYQRRIRELLERAVAR